MKVIVVITTTYNKLPSAGWGEARNDAPRIEVKEQELNTDNTTKKAVEVLVGRHQVQITVMPSEETQKKENRMKLSGLVGKEAVIRGYDDYGAYDTYVINDEVHGITCKECYPIATEYGARILVILVYLGGLRTGVIRHLACKKEIGVVDIDVEVRHPPELV